MNKFILTIVLVSTLALSACMETTGNKQLIGGGTGAVAGGLLGSQIGGGKGQMVAIGVGTLLGALAGSEVGKSLDRADQMYAERANTRAYNAPVGQSISWNNPESGNYGTITPVRDGTSRDGRYCREFQQAITVDGRQQTAYGTACRAPDGSWQIVNS